MGVGCGVFQKVDVGCGVFQKVVVGCGVFLKWGWTWTGVERLPSDASHWLPLAPLTPCCEIIYILYSISFSFYIFYSISFFFHFICLGHRLPLLPLTHSMQQRHRFNPRGRAKSSQVHLLCKECIVHRGPTYDSYAQTKTKIVRAI